MANTRTKLRKLTDANSDEKCLSDDAGVVERNLYKFSLHNGGYMLNTLERTLLYAFSLFVLVLFVWNSALFMKGFSDGLRDKVDDVEIGRSGEERIQLGRDEM